MTNVLDMLPSRITDRIWPEPMSGCWLWSGHLNRDGYGYTTWNGRAVRVHRVVFELENGVVLGELRACHRCDNRACVNPDHIFAGTETDNQDDKVAKGRQAKGEASGQAKLTEGDIHEIRARYDAGWPITALGTRYGVDHTLISLIGRRRAWCHVPESGQIAPRYLSPAQRKLVQAQERLRAEMGREPLIREIAAAVGVSPQSAGSTLKTVREFMRRNPRHASLFETRERTA